jgi:uncharacterized membrane protein YidH (DUF202 family)
MIRRLRAMNSIPKLLIFGGIVLIAVGLIWMAAGRFLGFLNLGRLPGDIVIEKENFKFYFPIVTCIVISVVLSLIMYVIRLFMK